MTKFQQKLNEIIQQHSYISPASHEESIADPKNKLGHEHGFDELDMVEVIIDIEDYLNEALPSNLEDEIIKDFRDYTAEDLYQKLKELGDGKA